MMFLQNDDLVANFTLYWSLFFECITPSFTLEIIIDVIKSKRTRRADRTWLVGTKL